MHIKLFPIVLLLLKLLFLNVIAVNEQLLMVNPKIFAGSSTLKNYGCGENGTTTVCSRKCCEENYIMLQNGNCSYNPRIRFNVPIFEKGTKTDSETLRIRFVPGFVKCEKDYGFYTLPSYKNFVSLRKDGKFSHNENEFFYDYKDFCIDYLEKFGIVAVVCSEDDDPGIFQPLTIAEGIYIIGEIISLPFLLATFVIYAILPDRTSHEKSLMCYVFALFMAFLLTISARFTQNEIDDAGCIGLGEEIIAFFGSLIQSQLFTVVGSVFFYVASFCWMNVMSFDIWWTFSGKSGFGECKNRSENKRFLLYSAYGWSIPLLLSTIITILSVAEVPYDSWYYPGIGEYLECWFKDEPRELLYFYGIMAISTVINIVLFVVTFCDIRQVQKDTAMLTRQGSKKHGHEDETYWFCLFLKLLLIMGLNWTMDIIAWGVDWMINNVPPAVWYLSDLCNALYGVLIFFIFCFNRKTWNQLKIQYYRFKGQPYRPKSTSTRTTSLQTRGGAELKLLENRTKM